MNATGPEDTLVGGFHGEPVPQPVPEHGPDAPVDVLTEPPDAPDVTAELNAPPSRGVSRVTLALAGAVLAAGGFWAGAETAGHDGGGTPAAAPGRAQGGAAAAQQGQGTAPGGPGQTSQGQSQGQTGRQGAGTGAAVTSGTVKLVDGVFIYLSDAGGTIVKVRTSDATTIQVQNPGTAGDLRPGDTVVVRGSAGADGVIGATSVTEGAQGPGAQAAPAAAGSPAGPAAGAATTAGGAATAGRS